MTNQMLVRLKDGRELSILKPAEDRLKDAVEIGMRSMISAAKEGQITMREGAEALLFGILSGDPTLSVMGDGVRRFEVAIRKGEERRGLAPAGWKQYSPGPAEYEVFGYVPKEVIQAFMDEVGVVSVRNPHWEVSDADSGLRGQEVDQPLPGEVHAHDSVEAPERADPDH